MENAKPIPEPVLGSFNEWLSSTADPNTAAQPCWMPVTSTVLHNKPCDVDRMEVTVSTDDESAKAPFTIFIPYERGGMPRSDTMDVVCGVRPFQNAGEGQSSDKKSSHLVRKPANVKVTVNYAATCGEPGHPAIHIEPEGGNKHICNPQVVAGTNARFEAFRLRNNIETSKLWVDGGPIFSVARFLWSFIDGEASCGSVTVRSESCGLRASGPCIHTLSTTILLYSEDELELVFKMPPLMGRSTKTERKSKSTSGESLVDENGEKKAAKDGSTYKSETRGQSGLGYREETRSNFSGTDGSKSSTSTVTFADWNKKDVSSGGYRDGGEFAFKKEDEHSGVSNYLAQRGFELTIKHNGQEVGLESIKSFAESCESILKTLEYFRDLWEAGPGVKVAVGWSTSWKLQFLQIECSAKWYRKVGEGGAKLQRHRDITATVSPVSGSATAAFGVVVVIERFTMEWLAIDLSASITLSGAVKGSLKWASERNGDAPWSNTSARKIVSGEIELALKATAKVTLVGRKVGCELEIESGLKAEGVLNTDSAISFEECKVELMPVVFTVSIWIGSTGEVDYTYEQEIFDGRPVYTYPPAAVA